MIGRTASMCNFEEARQTMAVLKDAMNPVFCLYTSDFRDLKELHEMTFVQELKTFVYLLL